MEFKTNDEEEDGSPSPLTPSFPELENFVSTQEIERYKRESSRLREAVSRLREDCNILRERELQDRERIKSLKEEIGRKDTEFAKRMVELKETALEFNRKERSLTEKLDELERNNWLLEHEVSELMKKCGDIETRKNFTVCDEDLVAGEKGESDGTLLDNINGKQSAGRKRDSVVLVISDSEGERGGREDSDVEEEKIPVSKGAVKGEKKDSSCSALNQHVDELGSPVDNVTADDEKAAARIPSSESPSKKQKVFAKQVQTCCRRNCKNQPNDTAYSRRLASSEQLLHAERRAQILWSNLKSCNASFSKIMTPSQISGGFWLGLPRQFCKDNLPADNRKMIVEDENGLEHEVNYFAQRTAFSGGWRGFALDHNLQVGDVLIFELKDPARFKVHITKAIPEEP